MKIDRKINRGRLRKRNLKHVKANCAHPLEEVKVSFRTNFRSCGASGHNSLNFANLVGAASQKIIRQVDALSTQRREILKQICRATPSHVRVKRW